MKKLFGSICLCFCIYGAFSQSSPASGNITTFIKVWGFLKYYHPSVATGEKDWDKEFTERFNSFILLPDKEAQNSYINLWISSLGEVTKCDTCEKDERTLFKNNYNLDWLQNESVFNRNVINQLTFIKKNRNQKSNYYIQQIENVGNTSFENEKPYKDSIYPSEPLRMLTLSRFWNIIEYFYPYKYKVGQNWDSVLCNLIPKFKNASDTTAYHLAILEMISSINDTHAEFYSRYTNRFFGTYWPPFTYSVIDDKAVVTGFYNDSICRLYDIQIGDAFLSVNQMPVQQIINERYKYISASNHATKIRNFFYAIFNGQTKGVATTFERDGIVFSKEVKRFPIDSFHYKGRYNYAFDTTQMLAGNIGYVNLGTLKKDQVDSVMPQFMHTRALILDGRNYPASIIQKICKYLNPHRVPMAVFTLPLLNFPGMYEYTAMDSCGTENPEYYIGKIVLIFDEHTQSFGEFMMMALSTAPNVVKVGSQTAGADGDVSTIYLPGKLETSFSGIGVYYPDGTETQRIGIVPDIEVKPTIESIRAGRDVYMEAALSVINKNIK